MAARVALALLLALPSAALGGGGSHTQQHVLLQTWEGAGAGDTPITRVVKLLKKMGAELQKEMDEDAALYDKLACWCNTNEYEKNAAITAAEAKITELTSTIESLTAKSKELSITIKQLEAEVAANKQSLAEATALREKEIQEFHGGELDSVQAIENLKAAILILSKHHGGALPQLSFSLLSLHGGGRKGRTMPWEEDQGESHLSHSFDDFLEKNGFASDAEAPAAPQKFLQATAEADATTTSGAPMWSAADVAAIRRAMRSASAFVQAHHGEGYLPSYAAQSGEILGVLRQLKEQMEGSLGDAQKQELARAAAFAELRASKQAEIDAGEKQAEAKEDQLAKTNMDLAEAKEDLEQTTAALSEDQKFMLNLKATCETADKNFMERKAIRLDEIKAVSQTIEILTADSARDTFSATYAAFLQLASTDRRRLGDRRRAAQLLRGVAAKLKHPELAVLATTVELDAFTRVKKAIDDMVTMLRTQQADEVKKHDWCGSELHDNEVATTKAGNLKDDLDAKVGELESTITTLKDEVAQAKASIATLQTDLQRATENRKQENLDFQTTISDQVATQEVLKMALDKLATFYDKENKESLAQTKAHTSAKQTPPVPQMEYAPHSGAEGVMQMLEKLVHEAADLQAQSLKSEKAAQAQYEAVIADTNASVDALQKEIVSKTENLAEAKRQLTETQGDLKDAVAEIDELGKYNSEIHAECDYLLSNFDTRQQARSQEIEALQQAKQILSGADLS